MNRSLLLLLTLIALYFAVGGINMLIYGDSYPFLSDVDYWTPDGNGGWVAHGTPNDPKPIGESVTVPTYAHYLPMLVPGLLLAAIMFTPLEKKLGLERKPKAKRPDDDTDTTTDTNEQTDEPKE